MEAQEKLFNFISSWQQACYSEKDEARRFYTYLGQIIQSKLMSDLVHLPENCPEGYEVAGDFPLMEYMRDYDLDEATCKALGVARALFPSRATLRNVGGGYRRRSAEG